MEQSSGIIDKPDVTTEQQFLLRWKYHHSNLQLMFAQLLERESYCDVTLACEGKTLRAHKVVLSACSSYFDLIFSKHEEKNPIVILKDVKFSDIKALVEFMYTGEITIDNARLNTLLQIAEELRIKGLAAVSWRPEGEGCWRSVESDGQKDSNCSVPILSSNHITKKRKISSEAEIKTKPVSNIAAFVGPEISESVISESSEEDSQEPLWDSHSHDGVYSESEEFKPSESEGSPNKMFTPVMAESGVSKAAGFNAVGISDVMKMTAYIQQGGRRPHFWETASTKRVMEAIKKKEIEMKVAAELLGVSYGTLYGRYRDAYGCLKHPYRARDFWHEPPSMEVINKLKKKEISLFKAAEILNVTVTTLANYLATLERDGFTVSTVPSENGSDGDSIVSVQQVLNHNPDITIVKKECENQDNIPKQYAIQNSFSNISSCSNGTLS